MLRIGTLVLGVSDIDRAVAFWRAALGFVPRPAEVRDDWVTLEAPDGSGRAISLQRSSSPVPARPRTHLDLYTDDAAEQAREVDRLVTLGAARVDWDSYPADPDFVVLADPDGNLFCVIDLAHG
jgi:catechol 2,3-dioxygenase-like lactoylglutathione lyase family enzyme